MNVVHRGLLKISGGRIGRETLRMPVLELTTVGRKSGRPHSVMLTSPIQDRRAIVVVASRGGSGKSPAWFLNLRDNPEVQVAFPGQAKQRRRARVASPEERARLWPLITANHRNYALYQTRTSRQIPVVLLDPTD